MTSLWCHHCDFYVYIKICQRQPTALKLCRLIVYPKFYKISKLENHVTINGDIMMSMGTMGKCGPPRNQAKYISFERFWWKLSKNVKFIEFEALCKIVWKPWPLNEHYHVTWLRLQVSKIFFLLILYLLSGKVTRFGENWLKNKMLQAKTNLRVKDTPNPQCL